MTRIPNGRLISFVVQNPLDLNRIPRDEKRKFNKKLLAFVTASLKGVIYERLSQLHIKRYVFSFAFI